MGTGNSAVSEAASRAHLAMANYEPSTTTQEDEAPAAGPGMSVPAIDIKAINKSFGTNHVLRNLTLAVAPGEVVVICGPSGSGKSTLIRCINRLELIQSGEILVFGESVEQSRAKLTKLRSEIGMVFQAFNLYPHKTALENIILAPMKVKRLARRAAEELGMNLLNRVGVADKAQVYPAYLSGGQQQRVAIARALAMQPKIMLVDEPTSALDPEMIHEVLEVIADLVKDGMTMAIITHEMGFARRISDRIVFMDEGQVIEEGPPETFFAAPKSARTKLFLSKILSQ